MGRKCSEIKITFWLLVVGGFFIWPIFSSGTANEVVINEIAWMGTSVSANDEWLELKNNTDQEIDLTGWALKAADGTPEIALSGTIPAQGYFLLERTDDSSVPDIAADLIYTGALSNGGENLELRDAQGNLVDSVNCSDSWFAGNNTTKQTMERKNPQVAGNDSANWQTSQEPGGTPKARNSSGEEVLPEEPEEVIEEPGVEGWIPPTVVNQPPIAKAGPDITALVKQEIIFDASQSTDPDNDTLTFFWNFGDGATETEEKASHIYLYPGQYMVGLLVSDGEFSDLDIITVNIYSRSVIISEFIPDPIGQDSENEWIELFNQSDEIANLTDWQLDDEEGGSRPFIFLKNSLIAPHQFLVLRRPITKLALNNDRDQVQLFYPDGSLASQVSYSEKKKEGFSIAFDGRDYFWTKLPTPGSANIITSVGLGAEGESISSNNPQPLIQETQEPPEVLGRINLSQSQNLLAFTPSKDSYKSLAQEQAPPLIESTKPSQLEQPKEVATKQTTESLPQQAASLAQLSYSDQKANLILTLSIIISGSLLASWLIISLKKKLKKV